MISSVGLIGAREAGAIRPEVVPRAVTSLSVVSNGLSTGAMLFIRLVMVPFWRGISPREFRAWFAGHSEGIRRLMVPLGAAAGLTSAAGLLVDLAEWDRPRPCTAVAAGGAAGVGAITFAVNEPANHEFVRPDLDDGETLRLLDRWVRWHNARVVLGFVATVAATRALGSRSR